MPRAPKGSNRFSQAGGILRDVFGEFFDFVGEAVDEVAPHCSLCGEIAVPLQCPCGKYACKSHGYFNFALGRAICPECAMSLGAAVESEDDEADEVPPTFRPRARGRQRRQRRPQRQQARQHEETLAIAWDLLGLDASAATEAEINKAYRQAARDCHPDLHPADTTAERRFKALQRAKEICLADAASRQEG